MGVSFHAMAPEGHTSHPFLGCSTLSMGVHNSSTCQEPAQGTCLWDLPKAPALGRIASKRGIQPLTLASSIKEEKVRRGKVPYSKASSQKHRFPLSGRPGFESCLYHHPAVWPWAGPSWLRASGSSSVKRA